MSDLISRQAAIDAIEITSFDDYGDYMRAREIIEDLPPAQPQGDEAIFWKKRAREYEDIIAGFVAEQAKGIKFDSITITEEGITFKKSQPERTGKWIRISPAKIYECSICGKNVMTADIDEYHFCHGCGARMEETT